MGRVPSLCVLCSPCYSRWCYGQILAIAPLQLMYGREQEKNTWHSSWERGRVNLIFSPNTGWDVSYVMGHVPSLCVLCSPCYSRWCYGQILAIAPLQLMYGREQEKNTWHSSWERGRVNLIFSPNTGWDVSYVMGHVPSLCVLCSPCYSRWYYGQILAIAPLQLMYGREQEKNTWHSSWERGRVNLIFSPNKYRDVS